MGSPVDLITNDDPLHRSEVSFDVERGLVPPTTLLKSLALLEKTDNFSGAHQDSSDVEQSSSPENQYTKQLKTYT